MLIQILELINVRYTCTSTLSNNFVAIHHNYFYEQVSIATDKSLLPFLTALSPKPTTQKEQGVNIDFFQLVKTNQSCLKYLLIDQSHFYQIMKADDTASPLTQSDIARPSNDAACPTKAVCI